MADGIHKLSPRDAEAAVRSFPRRFRGVLARPDDDSFDPDETARRVGPEGRSAADHLVAADGVLALADRALDQIRSDPDAVLHPSIVDLGTAEWNDDHTPVADLLDRFETTATRLADRIDALATDEWGQPAQVAGTAPATTPLAVVQDAVSVAASHLRSAQRTVDAVT